MRSNVYVVAEFREWLRVAAVGGMDFAVRGQGSLIRADQLIHAFAGQNACITPHGSIHEAES